MEIIKLIRIIYNNARMLSLCFATSFIILQIIKIKQPPNYANMKKKSNISKKYVAPIFFSLLLIFTFIFFIKNINTQKKDALLLAPMIGFMDYCILAKDNKVDDLLSSCLGPNGSASKLIAGTLDHLGKKLNKKNNLELGYTFQVPLLSLFEKKDDDWVINKTALQRLARTLTDTDRSIILFLYSNHYGVASEIEAELARDPKNISATQNGILPKDTYYGIDIFPWSFSTTDNGITQRRVQAISALSDEICRLPKKQIEKIKGITLLGELHHLFPNFENGMGFNSPYIITDYSEKSITDFRYFLQQKFQNIENLNQAIAENFSSFSHINPPSKDIRSQALQSFSEHIDPYAHGVLPISGWLFIKDKNTQPPLKVQIYRNGAWMGSALVNLGRDDVQAAFPALANSDVGWRFDLDFSGLEHGIHRLDVFLEQEQNLVKIGTRSISIMDKNQTTPAPLLMQELPPSVAPEDYIKYNLDYPKDQFSFYYNPLASLWHEFRRMQIVNYLSYFHNEIKKSCLGTIKNYTHQLIPFPNPSWDATRFAIESSLKPFDNINLGVSLYGEPTYGESFFNWKKSAPQSIYGITEFHPKKAMMTEELNTMFNQHRMQGAQFISFFMDPRWEEKIISKKPYILSFDPDNKQHHSDKLYHSVQELLEEK